MPLGPGQIALTSARLQKLRLDAGRLNAVLAPPPAPTSPNPAHGSSRGPAVLTWVGEGAGNFDVYFGTSATPPLVSSTQPASTYTLPALTAGTVYYWRIVSRNTFGTTSGPTWSFTATVPAAASNPSPIHGAADQSNTITLSWTAPATPDPLTYTLHYALAGAATVIVPGLTGTSYALPTLGNAQTVSWAVYPTNNAGATGSPPVWVFTTWTLGAPTLVSPADGAVEVSATTPLVWAAAANALSYDVYFGPSPVPPLVSSGQTALFYDPPGLLRARVTYAWRIVARNAGGTVSSVQWSFTTTDPTEIHIKIGGVTPHMRIAGLAITDQLNDRPNTCEFVVDTTPPTVGQVVEIGLGSLAITDLIFAGTVDQVEALYDLRPSQRAWQVRSVDWWRRFNTQKITRHYGEQAATAIASDLVTTFAPGFSTAGIAAGLPIVSGGIDFIHADLGEALRELMTRVGGYWYVDYGKIVHAFLEETTQPPDPLVPTLASLLLEPPVTLGLDLSQIRTRVLVQGGSSTAQTDVPAGGTEIPVDDASWYRPTGGYEVVIGPYRMPYTGTFAGGSGSVVRGEEAPTGAAGTPAAAITTGVGGVVGLVAYVVTFKNSIGETLPGPASNAVTGIPVAAPGSAPAPAAVAGVGRLSGTYLYAATVVTARGETTLGPTAPFTATPFAPPSAPPIVSPAGGLGHLIGAYSYAVAFRTAHGETLPGPAGVRTASALAAPSAPTLNAGGVGPLIGAYSYRVTFVTALGETTGGTVQSRTASAGAWSGSSSLSASGVGPLVGTYSYRIGYVTAYGETLGGPGSIAPTLTQAAAPTVSQDGAGFLIDYAVTYVHPEWGESAMSARTTARTTVFNITCNGLPAGCGWNLYSSGSNASGGPLYKIAELPNNTTTFTHASQTGPAGNPNPTMGRGVLIASIQAGLTGTVARRIYRTKVGGASYYLVGEIANGVTSFLDVAPDTSLTTPAPSFNTTGEAIAVSAIATGPSGVVARRIYRTKAGGASYYLAGELADNTTSTYTDNVPDDSLTASLPVVATAGGERHSVSVAIGPTGTLARRIYRTKAGGTTYHQLAELPENTTASYVDDTSDDGLAGAGPEVVSTAGGLNADVSLPVGPAGTTSRRLYRTKAGAAGALYLVGQVNGNAAGSLLDEKRDSELGRVAPNANDAGASIVLVSSIPIGPASITARRLYRRDAAGVYRFVVELKDNTTTTHTDDKDEDKLGDVAPTVSTIGALPGTTTLLVAATWPFRAAGGWITSGSQIIRYSGISGTTLTGIPASGPGSLVAALKAGDEVIATPLIIGVTSTVPIARGDPVAVLERVDDLAAQAALAALEGAGSDGIYVHIIRDSKLDARMAHATGVADLQLFARPIETLTYGSRDPKTGTGKTIHADLPALGILGDYTIQHVQIDQISASPGVFPRYTVTASSARFSFADALRRLALLP